ncbi:undecaprenyl-diphosphate phosphatase [archaeon]|nr:undecaprenyl-diphosphate phosphatase [archaeon]
MELLEAVVLGVIQGVFEWLPVSSEGINSLIMVNFFGKTLLDAAVIAIWLHTGTLLAALVYFRDDMLKLFRNFPLYLKNPKKETDTNTLTSFLIISTFLTGVVGLPLFLFGIGKANISGATATALIGILLILTGLLQKYSKKAIDKKDITKGDAALVGGLQAFSVLPGISRSGITVSVLLLRNYDARSALKLSFLMSIPAVLAAEVGLALLGRITLDAYSLVSVVISFAFGILTIDALLKIGGRINFGNFCIILGVLSITAVLL